jgi:hypothetical protein
VIFQEKVSPGASQGFAVFTGVFEGVFGKSGNLGVVFVVHNVVECVVNVVRCLSFFW